MIKEFRDGIFSVADTRKEAIKMLRNLENGKDPKEQKKMTNIHSTHSLRDMLN